MDRSCRDVRTLDAVLVQLKFLLRIPKESSITVAV